MWLRVRVDMFNPINDLMRILFQLRVELIRSSGSTNSVVSQESCGRYLLRLGNVVLVRYYNMIYYNLTSSAEFCISTQTFTTSAPYQLLLSAFTLSS